MNNIFSVVAVLVLSNPIFGNDSEFTYVEPNSIQELSKDIVLQLKNEGCLIPKWIHEFGGVTKGQFSESGQEDVAVLCRFGDSYSIRVFWGGASECASKIDSFGQFISNVDKKYILNHYESYGGNTPPLITHQGINDHYLEKSSFVKYCHQGQWLELTGAD